jgi:hypothetical protein
LILRHHIKATAMDATAAAAAPAAPTPTAVAGSTDMLATTNAALAGGMAASLPSGADEPGSKRAKMDEGSHVSFAQAVASKSSDPDLVNFVLQYVAENMEHHVAAEAEMSKLMEAKSHLEKKDNISKESHKAMIMEAMDTFNTFYKNYAPNTPVSDASRNSFTDLLVSNAQLKPEIIEFLRPMMVAASSLCTQQQQQQVSAKEQELQAAMSKINALQQQIGVARKLGAPAVNPNWQAAPAAPTPVVPAQIYAPPAAGWQVDVAASGAMGAKALPPALAGLLPYGETRMKMMPHDFSNNGKLAQSRPSA